MSKTNLNKKSVKTKMKSRTDVHTNSTDKMTRIAEITTEELRTAINKHNKRQITRQQRNQSRRHRSMRR